MRDGHLDWDHNIIYDRPYIIYAGMMYLCMHLLLVPAFAVVPKV